MTQVSLPEIIGRIRGYRDYFARFAKEEPSFLPELRVANEVLLLIEDGSVGEPNCVGVERALAGVDENHYDGSGWHGFNNAVQLWLETARSGR
jgi:hypothetical protein